MRFPWSNPKKAILKEWDTLVEKKDEIVHELQAVIPFTSTAANPKDPTLLTVHEQPPEYKLFHSGSTCVDAITDMINRAKTQIDIETFYFIPDSIGRPILDLLIEKAKAGVKVRVLADTMGSFGLSQSLYIEAFKQAGAQIRFFNSVVPFSRSKKAFWFFRNHRRAIIIDKQELMIGSFCIGEPTCDWIETAILIKHSSAVMQATKAFKQTWHKSPHPTFKMGTSSKLSTDCFSYITQAPLQRQRFIYRSLINDIRRAKTELVFAAPYIVPDNRLLRSIKKARKRGVRVHIITSAKTDSKLADLGRNSYVLGFLHKGVSLHFLDKMIHSKVVIVDQAKAYIGSLNLDNISLRYNYESTLITDSLTCVTELRQSFDQYIENLDYKMTETIWKRRSFFTKFLEKLVWPVRKLL